MKKTISWFVKLLALTLACLVLVGCGGTANPGTTTTTGADVTGSTDTDATTTDAQDVSTTVAGDSGSTTTVSAVKGTTTKGNTTTTTKGNTTTTTKAPTGGSSALKQSAYVKDASVWKSKLLSSGKFYFELEITSIGTRNNRLLKNSITKNNVGEYASILPSVKAAEWGYSVLNLPTGTQDGAGRVMTNVYLDNKASITTRAQALAKIKEFVLSQYVRGAANPWYSMNGHHSWHHYAGEFGFDVLASEIGENIHGYQFHLAMNRGAARQYAKPWAIDFSSWHGAGILDYSSNPIWTGYSGTNRGHSLSLVERSFVASYMSGASSVVAEAGGGIAFYDNQIEGGLYKITPYGQVCKDFNEFTQKYTDVGITYTPIAIALDYYHGLDRHASGNYVFGKFAYNSGDTMTHNLVDKLWPGTWAVERNGNETGALSNTAYGDSFDFLLQNASQAVLNSYPAIVLSGDMTLSSAEVSRYKSYVKQGGILVLNTAYLNQFPEYKGTLTNNRRDVTDGKGKVIVYGPDYDISKLDSIFKELLAQLMPFTFSTNIESIVNVKDGYMYVTLINNDGVTKTSQAAVQVNSSKKKTVTVNYTGSPALSSVKEIYGGRNVALNGKSTSVTISPGEIAILEYKFK